MKKVQPYELCFQDAPAFWADLPWPGCHISLKSCGDMGPSGMGDAAVLSRRQSALDRLGVPDSSRPTLAAGTVLVPRQTHTLRLLCPLASGRLELWEGSWDSSQNRLAISCLPHLSWNPQDVSTLVTATLDIEADGWLTDHPGLDLGVTVADCMNLFFRSPALPALRGLVHSGWQGTGIGAVLIAAAHAIFGLNPSDLELLCGPSVAPLDYPVPSDRASLFARRFGAAFIQTAPDGQPCLDLVGANHALAEGRVPCLEQPLRGTVSCLASTSSTPRDPRFQSYRRDGRDPAVYGRMLALWRSPLAF